MLNRLHDFPESKSVKTSFPDGKTKNSDDNIYPGSEHFIALSKKNPKKLGEILQTQISNGMNKLYQERKAAGLSVTYRDENYPNVLIREYPDNRRFIIELDAEDNYKEKVIREIPPRETDH